MLNGEENTDPDGNHLLDKLFGADIRFVSADDYRNRRMDIMKEIKAEMSRKGYRPYIIPMGASNGLGAFGYYGAMDEILEQEKELGFNFDAVVTAVGSGATYAGLYLKNKLADTKKVYGVNVSNDADGSQHL